MQPIGDAATLLEARSQPCALVFLWVAWAGQARRSESVVKSLVEGWASLHPDHPVPAYVADLSDQSGEVWRSIREWLAAEAQAVDNLTYGGYGALLWSKLGIIILSLPYAGEHGVGKLLALTESAFQQAA